MKNTYRSLAIISALSLCGCAMIFDGQSQQIAVNTNPPGASCNLIRNGESIGTIPSTPSSIYIKKSKYDLKIECSAPGYQTATYLNHSGVAGATYGDIAGLLVYFVGGPVSWGIDSASGSDNKYDSPVNLTLPLAPTGLDALPNPSALPVPAPQPGSQPAITTQPSAIQTK